VSGGIGLPIVSKFDDSGLRQAQVKIGAFQGIALGAFAKIGAVAVQAMGQAIAATGRFAVDSVKAASDFNEATAAVGQVFGQASQDIESFAASAAKSLGQSQTQALEAAKTFGIFASAAGLSGQGAADFSKQMVTLATDLASFNNTSIDEAITAIGAGLRGENEPLRRFGVLLDDATLKARAMEIGIYNGTGALTSQQKVLAAQAEILAQTSTQQGDFARTQDGMANSIKILQATFENFKITVGENLLPAITPAIQTLAEQLSKMAENPKFIDLIQQFGKSITELTPSLLELLPPLTELIITVIPILITLIPILNGLIQAIIPVVKSLADKITDLTDGGNLLFFALQILLPPLRMIGAAFNGAAVFGKEFETSMIGLVSPLGSLIDFLVNIDYYVTKIIDGFAQLFGFSARLPTGAQLNMSAAAGGIPGLASGGIVTQPTLAMIGEGAGPEAVIPLNQLNKYAPAASGSSSTYNINISTLKADATIGEVVVNAIKKYERRSGAVFAGA